MGFNVGAELHGISLPLVYSGKEIQDFLLENKNLLQISLIQVIKKYIYD